jgi:antirestriction protein ArdC
MKAEQVKKMADEALANLATALERGQSDAMKTYLAALSRFHHYSFGNVMLIAMQKPDATRVAGFQTWKSFGRYVKKGEKGILIIAPMVIRSKGDAGEENGDGEDRTILRFKAVYVFDVSQTDGEPLPEPARIAGDPSHHTERLKAFVASMGIELAYSDSLGTAAGMSQGGKITLAQGLSPAEEFSVLVHELAHEMLHPKDAENRPSKTVRETEAEAVAFVVSQAIGLDTSTAASDYIQVYQGDKGTLAESLDRIQQTATAIIQAVTETEDDTEEGTSEEPSLPVSVPVVDACPAVA